VITSVVSRKYTFLPRLDSWRLRWTEVGFSAVITRTHFALAALRTLGDRYHAIEVSVQPFHGLPGAYILPGLRIREKPRLIDHGPFAYVCHSIYTQVSFSLFARPRSLRPTCTVGTLLLEYHSLLHSGLSTH